MMIEPWEDWDFTIDEVKISSHDALRMWVIPSKCRGKVSSFLVVKPSIGP